MAEVLGEEEVRAPGRLAGAQPLVLVSGGDLEEHTGREAHAVAHVVVEEPVLQAELDVPDPGLPGRGHEGIVVDEAGLEQGVGVEAVLEPEVPVQLEPRGDPEAQGDAVDRDVLVLGVAVEVVAEQGERHLALRQGVGRRHVEEARGALVGGRGRVDLILLAVDLHRPGLHFFLGDGVAMVCRGGGRGGLGRGDLFVIGRARRGLLRPGRRAEGEQPAEQPGGPCWFHRTSSLSGRIGIARVYEVLLTRSLPSDVAPPVTSDRFSCGAGRNPSAHGRLTTWPTSGAP